MNTNANQSTIFSKYQSLALSIAIIGLSIAGYGLFQGITTGNERHLFSWLIGWSVWMSISIGVLMLVMIGYIFGAGWSVIIRRQLEHLLVVFPYLGLLLLPLVAIAWFHPEHSGLIWKWINPHALMPHGHTVAEDVIYHSKAAFLNLPFFTIRIFLYFAILCTLSFFLRKHSFLLDTDHNPLHIHRARQLSAAGIPLTALTLTFCAFDLFKSIHYHWFSTMYGVWFFATSMRAGLAFTILLCAFLARKKGPLHGIMNDRHRYQLGCISLAFVVFWAYISFCQYFLIYNANIPEETFWYNMRELNIDGTKNSWWYVSIYGLILCYFAIPFFYLLLYKNKICSYRLSFIAIWILVFHIIDLYFNILPYSIVADNLLGYITAPFSISPYDVASYLGTGGLCLWAFFKSMRFSQAASLPIHDPYIKESVFCHQP